MTSVFAATMFLLAFVVVPGPISRLVGAKFAAMFLAATGVLVLPVVLGTTWHATLAMGFDVALLLVGAKLAGRFGFARQICAIWITRIVTVVSAGLSVLFFALALMVTSLDGRAIDALPYDLLSLLSGVVLAVLLSRGQKQVLTRKFAGSLVPASPQA